MVDLVAEDIKEVIITIFHIVKASGKLDHIKCRNGMDLKEAEDIKKRWQEYTGEKYKIDLHDPDNHDGVTTHLEPDISECEVKRVSGSMPANKASGVMEFQLS